jgi:hypothetical protein
MTRNRRDLYYIYNLKTNYGKGINHIRIALNVYFGYYYQSITDFFYFELT